MNLVVEERKEIDSGNRIFDFLKKQGLIIAFLLLVIIFSCISNDFLSSKNILLVLRQVSIIGVMACAMTLVMIGGNFDLSIGSTLSLTTILSLTLHDKLNPTSAIVISLAVGLLIGCINGFLVGFLKMNSFITTLGMLSVLSALTLVYSNGSNVTIADNTWFGFIGRGYVLGIPFPVIIFAVTALILGIVLKKTVYGRYLYAVGGNKVASLFSGIKESRVVFITFVISGLTASIGGIMLASRLMTALNNEGQGREMDVISAVILGGTSLLGGSGSIFKTIIGVLILGILENGMILMGLPYYARWIATWIIIIVAIWIDIASKRRSISV